MPEAALHRGVKKAVVLLNGGLGNQVFRLASTERHIPARSSYRWWATAFASEPRDAATMVYPDPWLPNAWGNGRLPDLGLDGWIRVPAEFA